MVLSSDEHADVNSRPIDAKTMTNWLSRTILSKLRALMLVILSGICNLWFAQNDNVFVSYKLFAILVFVPPSFHLSNVPIRIYDTVNNENVGKKNICC